jgi:hypothetical protein
MEAAMSQPDSLQSIQEAVAAWNAHDVERYAALLDDGYVEETHARPTFRRRCDDLLISHSSSRRKECAELPDMGGG